jgi:hypothetical protein
MYFRHTRVFTLLRTLARIQLAQHTNNTSTCTLSTHFELDEILLANTSESMVASLVLWEQPNMQHLHDSAARGVLQLHGEVRTSAEEAAVGGSEGAGAVAAHNFDVLRGRGVSCGHDVYPDVAGGGGANASARTRSSTCSNHQRRQRREDLLVVRLSPAIRLCHSLFLPCGSVAA